MLMGFSYSLLMIMCMVSTSDANFRWFLESLVDAVVALLRSTRFRGASICGCGNLWLLGHFCAFWWRWSLARSQSLLMMICMVSTSGARKLLADHVLSLSMIRGAWFVAHYVQKFDVSWMKCSSGIYSIVAFSPAPYGFRRFWMFSLANL